MNTTRINELRRRLSLGALFSAAAGPLIAAKAANPSNQIVAENSLAGTSGWQISHWSTYFDWSFDTLGVDPYPEVEGYASAHSVNLGESIRFFVNCRESAFTLRIYRLGWYNGVGARQVLSVTLPGRQQNLPLLNALGTADCNWIESTSVVIPSTWTAGIYVAKLIAGTSGAQSFITFVVRNDASTAEHLFQCALNTSAAYNNWGGKSLYEFNSKGGAKAKAISFNRPDADGGGAGQVFHWELSMARFLEKEGYDVTYVANVDVHRDPSLLTRHRSFLSVGHDEYWSYQQKKAVQDAQAAGVHCGFFSANTSYWQIRFAPDDRGAVNRIMTSYKELAYQDPFATDADQANNKFITSKWREVPSYGVSDPVARPENALIGVMYSTDPVNADVIVFDPGHWVFAGTGVVKGTRFTGLSGYEVDSMFNNGYQPTGIRKLCESPDGKGALSHSTIFVAPSGSTVFASGTMQWSWGLNFFPSWAPNSGSNRVNAAVQQATRNILNRFELPALLAPANLRISSPGSGQVLLQWDTVPNATSYDVYRAQTSGGQGLTAYRAGLTSPSLADTGLTNGTQYFYKVVARVGVGESAASAEVIGIPAGGSLIAQSIAFGGLSSQQVGASFTISASASSGLPVSFTSLTPAVASISGNVVTSLAVGTAVIAANQVGNAQYSTAPQVTQSFAVTQATAIQPPTGLTGYACDTGCWAAYQGLGIRINWTQSSSPNIVSNTIYRGNGQTGATSVVGTIPAGTFYLDKNVVKGQTYHYLVSATSSSGVTSALSNDTAVPF